MQKTLKTFCRFVVIGGGASRFFLVMQN